MKEQPAVSCATLLKKKTFLRAAHAAVHTEKLPSVSCAALCKGFVLKQIVFLRASHAAVNKQRMFLRAAHAAVLIGILFAACYALTTHTLSACCARSCTHTHTHILHTQLCTYTNKLFLRASHAAVYIKIMILRASHAAELMEILLSAPCGRSCAFVVVVRFVCCERGENTFLCKPSISPGLREEAYRKFFSMWCFLNIVYSQ